MLLVGKTEQNIETKKKSKLKSFLKIVITVILTAVILLTTYFWLCFTNNSFISKYRTLYVETAMSTLSHQWLATKLLPYDVVKPVIDSTHQQFEENLVDSSSIAPPKFESSFDIILNSKLDSLEYSQDEMNKLKFEKKYTEIDMSTMPEDLDYSEIQISNILDKGIKTIYGDRVWAIDTVNNLIIIEVTGDNYVGKLAIVKDSSQVYLATSSKSGVGQTVTDICKTTNSILGINASGFADFEGKGNGGTPIGIQISKGEQKKTVTASKIYQTAGFDFDNNFRVGKEVVLDEMRDAMQFYPIIVLNGDKVANGSYGLGIQPRTAIGQTMTKDTLMLVIDGRQIGYSVGTTMTECAEIMIRYGAWNAMNLDGGSSSSMTYNGEMITRTSSPAKQGRYVPSAWVVEKQSTD